MGSSRFIQVLKRNARLTTKSGFLRRATVIVERRTVQEAYSLLANNLFPGAGTVLMLLRCGFRLIFCRRVFAIFRAMHGHGDAERAGQEPDHEVHDRQWVSGTEIKATQYEEQAHREPELRNTFVYRGREPHGRIVRLYKAQICPRTRGLYEILAAILPDPVRKIPKL
jgi:hypothetical protein